MMFGSFMGGGSGGSNNSGVGKSGLSTLLGEVGTVLNRAKGIKDLFSGGGGGQAPTSQVNPQEIMQPTQNNNYSDLMEYLKRNQ